MLFVFLMLGLASAFVAAILFVMAQAREGRLGIASPVFIFCTTFILSFLVRPGFILFTSYEREFFHYSEWATIGAMILGFFGLISFAVGYLHRSFDFVGRILLPAARLRFDSRAIRRISLIGFAAAIGFLAQLFGTGVATLSDVLEFGLRKSFLAGIVGGGHMTFLTTVWVLGASASLYLALTDSARSRLFFDGAFVLCTIIFFLLLQSRQLVIQLILAGYLLLWLKSGPIRRTLLNILICGVIATVSVIFFIAIFHADQDVSVLVGIRYVTETFDSVDFLQKIIANDIELLWGLSWLQDVVFTYLPRVLFEDKPLIYGTVLAQHTVVPEFFEQVGINATFPIGTFGEGYLNFSVPGVVLVGFVMGSLAAHLYRGFLVHRDFSRFAILAGMFLNVTIYSRSFGSIFAALVFVQLLLVFVQLLLVATHFLLRRAKTTCAVTLLHPSRQAIRAQ